MKHLFRKPAFTLAEVLITLTIIGVIAAIVIPNLKQKHLEAEMIAKIKKNYSILSSAYQQAVRENGPTGEWGSFDTEGLSATEVNYNNAAIFFEKIKPYLKIHKDCGKNKGCFASSYKALFLNTAHLTWMDGLANRYAFMLEDGTSVSIHTGDDLSKIDTRGYLFIDLNNKKGPNRVGVDVFLLMIKKQNLVPYYKENQCEYNRNDIDTNGESCIKHVLTHGNMDYLRKSITED